MVCIMSGRWRPLLPCRPPALPSTLPLPLKAPSPLDAAPSSTISLTVRRPAVPLQVTHGCAMTLLSGMRAWGSCAGSLTVDADLLPSGQAIHTTAYQQCCPAKTHLSAPLLRHLGSYLCNVTRVQGAMLQYSLEVTCTCNSTDR